MPKLPTRAIMEQIFKSQQKIQAELGLRKVPAIPNSKFVRHGTKAYRSAMARYGFKPTQPGPYSMGPIQADHENFSWYNTKGVAHSLWRLLSNQKDDGKSEDKPGEVDAQDQQYDTEYLCEVSIGTPPQKALLDFDTGSADLWVRPEVFKNDRSSTFQLLKDKSWTIQYGDGSKASGFVGSDLLEIGGLKIKDQAIEVAKEVSSQFSQGKIGGLLGLAFKQINTVTTGSLEKRDPQPTPVDNMITQEDIPKDAELFTTAFYSSRDKEKSFYTFGWIDQGLVKESGEEIAWAPIDNSQGFWMFKSESATVNGNKVAISGNHAIADTGTTLALVSDKVCEALYKDIKGASYSKEYQGWVIPKTTTVEELPEFSVAVGDKEFVIQKEDLILAEADSENYYGGVQSRGEMSFDILGDTFLKSIYAIFDQGNSRFGAVAKIEKTQNITPATAPESSEEGRRRERWEVKDFHTFV